MTRFASAECMRTMPSRDFRDAVRSERTPLVAGRSVLPAMRVLQQVRDVWDQRFGARTIPGRLWPDRGHSAPGSLLDSLAAIARAA